MRAAPEDEKFKRIQENLKKIERGEIVLVGELNEDYDDWYNSEASEYLFEDPEGMGLMVEEACQFVDESIKRHALKKGMEIASELIDCGFRSAANMPDIPTSSSQLRNCRIMI